jgi:hypothetical protein
MNVLAEVKIIRDEISQLNDKWGDVPLLESLTNNLVFLFSKFQQNPPADSSPKLLQKVADAISELLNTLNKEIAWAKELLDTDQERLQWFRKAKYQILEDTEFFAA